MTSGRSSDYLGYYSREGCYERGEIVNSEKFKEACISNDEHKLDVYACDACEYFVDTWDPTTVNGFAKVLAQEHSKLHRDEFVFTCPTCHKKFGSYKFLQAHELLKHAKDVVDGEEVKEPDAAPPDADAKAPAVVVE